MDSDEFEVWPDNWAPLDIFMAMGTQWRTGMSGATGLDYGVLSDVMRFRRVPETEQPEMFDWVRMMEVEALSQMRE